VHDNRHRIIAVITVSKRMDYPVKTKRGDGGDGIVSFFNVGPRAGADTANIDRPRRRGVLVRDRETRKANIGPATSSTGNHHHFPGGLYQPDIVLTRILSLLQTVMTLVVVLWYSLVQYLIVVIPL
jgi:hypothetical protein